jgi:hypothetical protein
VNSNKLRLFFGVDDFTMLRDRQAQINPRDTNLFPGPVHTTPVYPVMYSEKIANRTFSCAKQLPHYDGNTSIEEWLLKYCAATFGSDDRSTHKKNLVISGKKIPHKVVRFSHYLSSKFLPII